MRILILLSLLLAACSLQPQPMIPALPASIRAEPPARQALPANADSDTLFTALAVLGEQYDACAARGDFILKAYDNLTLKTDMQ